MTSHRPFVATITLLFLAPAVGPPAEAQDWAKPSLAHLHRLDLRDLGYPMVNEIPANSSAITSLMTSRDGTIYGGTSGEEAYLFLFDPAINKVRHLGKVPGQGGIHHALVQDYHEGSIYFGTGKNMLEPLALTPGAPGGEHIDQLLWRDIKNSFRDYPGGHLYRYRPAESNSRVKLPDMPCDAEDLGIPVPGNSIYALAFDHRKRQIYGLTYPDGRFFVYDIRAAKPVDVGPVDEEVVFHGPERHWRSLPRALLVDDSGRVFTSGTGGALIYYSPASGKLVRTGIQVPGDYYHVQFYRDHAVIECLALSPSGLIYGGTCDGYLFSLDSRGSEPRAMKLVNLGKARASRRLRCLAIGANGKVYFMAGERSAARPCQCYCYDPHSGGFEDLGLLIVDRSPYYYWRGYQFDSMTTGIDGTIYLGESDRRAHLFLFLP